MRDHDLRRLNEPYGGAVTPADERIAESLDVSTPRFDALIELILADLSHGEPFGIEWMVPGPGTKRRILVSDQLYACAHSTRTNLIESALHRLEFEDFAEREGDRLADSVRVQSGHFRIHPAPPRSAWEEMWSRVIELNAAGVVRALSGALDCLAGVITGVTGLRHDLLGTSFGKTLARLRLLGAGPVDNQGIQAQIDFRQALERHMASAGPPGWTEWMLDFRNMLIHRGRRLNFIQLVPREPLLLGADGEPILRVRPIFHLPADPGLSDVEAIVTRDEMAVLAEDASVTLGGLVRSTVSLVDGAGADLAVLWQRRRLAPELLSQPREQWRDGVSQARGAFAGYEPETAPPDLNQLASGEVGRRRFTAAALFDNARHRWAEFD